MVLVNDNDDSRKMIEQCYKRHKTTLNPIIDWTDADVWEFIHEYHVPYCKLYDEGFKRLGCIGCPMARRHGREREFARYPRYRKLYINAFDRMLEERRKSGKNRTDWETGMDVFNWWMGYDILTGQVDLFDMEDDT